MLQRNSNQKPIIHRQTSSKGGKDKKEKCSYGMERRQKKKHVRILKTWIIECLKLID